MSSSSGVVEGQQQQHQERYHGSSRLEVLSNAAAAVVELAKGGGRVQLVAGSGTLIASPVHQAMLQTMQPRVPVAGVKRRWGGRPANPSVLQESSSEVSSSGVLSPPPPPPHYQPATPESANHARTPEDPQLWDLDLHPRQIPQQMQTSHHQVVTASTTLSPCPTLVEGRLKSAIAAVCVCDDAKNKKFIVYLHG